MLAAAEDLRFEYAAKLRDEIKTATGAAGCDGAERGLTGDQPSAHPDRLALPASGTDKGWMRPWRSSAQAS